MARKKGSGRTKGATSCVRVSLKDLCNVLQSEKATVVVSRRWALQVGINARYEISDMDCKPMYADTKTIEALGSAVGLNIEGDVELVVSNLDEDYPNGPITQGDKNLLEMEEVLDW